MGAMDRRTLPGARVDGVAAGECGAPRPHRGRPGGRRRAPRGGARGRRRPDLDRRGRVRHRPVALLDPREPAWPDGSVSTSSPCSPWSARSPSASTWPGPSSASCSPAGGRSRGGRPDGPGASSGPCSNGRPRPPTATRTAHWPSSTSNWWFPVICCSWPRARWFRSTGRWSSSSAVLDESALTGESLPVERVAGDRIRSGVVNAGAPVDLRATTTAAESTYAGVVRLVAEAERSQAPVVRLADRYAVGFLGCHAGDGGGGLGHRGSRTGGGGAGGGDALPAHPRRTGRARRPGCPAPPTVAWWSRGAPSSSGWPRARPC